MSCGEACHCDESRKHVVDRNWKVLDYKCNYSAFSGRRYTPSAYSAVTCKSCGASWRTKATFVEKLPGE